MINNKFNFNAKRLSCCVGKCVAIPALVLSSLFTPSSISAETYVPSKEIIQAKEDFRDMGFGIFIHWGLYSMLARGEWALNYNDFTHDEYKKLAGAFYPASFSADEWVRQIKDSGAKYITVTSRHHDGFSLFDTAYSDYDVMDATPFKRDIIKELAEACEKYGIKLHLYYSQLDWGRDDYYPLGRTGRTTGRTTHGKWEDYLTFMNNQLTELLTNYGNIGAIWFDGLWDMDETPGGMDADYWKLDEQYKLIHTLQPSCLIGNNHHTTPYEGEDIQIFERDKPGENSFGLSGQQVSHLPLETCQTMNHSWGYRLNDMEFKSTEELIRYLVDTAGKDANLLLNIGPRPDGKLPDQSVDRLKGMGEWMKDYAPTVQGVRGGPVAEATWGATTKKGNKVFVHIFDKNLKYVFIPVPNNKVKSACEFLSRNKVKFTSTNEGVILNIDKRGDALDYVIELTFSKTV